MGRSTRLRKGRKQDVFDCFLDDYDDYATKSELDTAKEMI